MSNAIDRITLDVHSSAVQGSLRWKMGDTARSIMASFTDNGKPWEISPECQVSVYFKKPDGNVVWGACYNSGASVFGYDVIGDETALSGKLECEFRVYNGDKLLTSPRFIVIVDETVYDENAIYSESKETFLTESVNKMISATAEAEAVYNEVQTKLNNGEFNGKDGKDGTNGYTPIKGVDYFDGKNGKDGKSAYEYAVGGGYDESEETFYGDLANVGSAGGGADLSDDLPLMDGEASAGVSEEVARADHVHPTDTTRMPLDFGGMTSFRGALDNADRLPVRDTSTDETKSCTWSTILSAIKKYVDPIIAEKIEEAITNGIVEASYAVSDSNGSNYAFLPEGMKGDGILALQSDIVKALVGYATEEYVKGYAQKKGEYLIPQDLAEHNTDKTAHNDIRLLIDGLTARLNALADSDDTTLDQLSEVVEYIKANRGLIESVTTSKVNVADIIDNLVTNVANKPLSAAQGVALKALIDAITVPTKLSELSGDSTHRTVTDAEKAAWNAKSNFSGKYADLEGKPTIPAVPTKVSAFENDAGYVTDDKTITITGVDENGVTHTWTVYGVAQ